MDVRLYRRFRRIVASRISKAEKRAREEMGLDDIDDQGAVQGRLFIARMKAVKSIYSALEKVSKFVRRNYKKELSFSGDRYPRQWMLDDKRIKEKLDTYAIVEILNYIDWQSRGKKGQQYKDMVDLTDEVTGGKKHKYEDKSGDLVKRDYAVFLTNKKFYEKMTREIGLSKGYIQKFLQSFCKSGIFIQLGRCGREGMLYADGFFTQWDNKPRKHTFLKNTREFREALRNFKPAGISSIY